MSLQLRKRKSMILRKAQETIALFKTSDASITNFFSSAFWYAVFPSIGKGVIGIGGAGGKGIIYKQGQIIGGSKYDSSHYWFSVWRPRVQ